MKEKTINGCQGVKIVLAGGCGDNIRITCVPRTFYFYIKLEFPQTVI